MPADDDDANTCLHDDVYSTLPGQGGIFIRSIKGSVCSLSSKIIIVQFDLRN
jgi:hypothetical protein